MSVHIPSHLQDAEAELLTAWKRIAELESEVARLTTLQLPADLSRGEALAYRSEDHGPAKKPIR